MWASHVRTERTLTVVTPAAIAAATLAALNRVPAGTTTSPDPPTTSTAAVRPWTEVSSIRAGTSAPSCPVRAMTLVRPRSVPQSSSRMTTSWETSTSRRVRYPESAVRRAVSAWPLRPPCVEMKYSRTVRPSRKFDLMGRSMMSPFGLATRPRMAAI